MRQSKSRIATPARVIDILGVFSMGIVVLALMTVSSARAQTAISADGVVESTSGGFKFPDGTMQATAAASGVSVADTGQTKCYDSAGIERNCTGTGEDGEFQAGVVWPTPRFGDNGDGTITDNLTGLIWLKDTNCPVVTLTWQQALDWVKNPLNSGGTACSGYAAGAFADWRMPNIKELQSLVDYSQSSPPLTPGHPFANVDTSAWYWSSTTFVSDPERAWDMPMNTGSATRDGKGDSYSVWPVRGGK